ncbi:MAG: hypothetical protein AAF560_12375 [Acidobacteriota bacterium]
MFDPAQWRWVKVGLGLTTAATIALEIVLTRIFSVVLWYHYGFLIVSLALLGMGLAGVFVYLYPERFPRDKALTVTAAMNAAFAATTVGALLLIYWVVSVGSHWPLGVGYRTLIFLAAWVPFFFGGLAVAVPISRFTDRIGPLYAADLVGAAIGALIVIPLLAVLGGPPSALFCAVLMVLATCCFMMAAGRKRAALAAGLVAALGLVAVGIATETDALRLRYAKNKSEENVIAEKWNSFSRVAVHREADKRWSFGWNLGEGAPRRGSITRWIRIDGHAGTPMIGFEGDFEELRYLGYDMSSLGYQLRSPKSALVIGSGGGRDILTAKLLGAENVHAVEINPLVVSFVRETFSEFSGSPYDLPGVSWTVADGRNFAAAQGGQTFDVVQLAAVDTTAALAAGALSLVENSLYTVEAFENYYDVLSDDGVLAVTRNWRHEAPMMALRAADLVQAAWTNRGHENPEKHLVIVAPKPGTRANWGTLLASRSPITAAEVADLRQLVESLGFSILFDPTAPQANDDFRRLFSDEREAFLAEYPYDVRATTDDKPYFFFIMKPFLASDERPQPKGVARLHWASRKTPRILMQALTLVAAIVFVFVFLIPIIVGRLKFSAMRGAGSWLLYFAGIGLGFILVEISLIQRHTLLLGQPLYAFSITLATILIFSGLGSLVSQSVPKEALQKTQLRIVLLIVAGSIAHAFLMGGLLNHAMHWSLGWRLALTLVSLAPLGFVMGFPLPLGMRSLEMAAPKALAWGWGVNGSLSVLGTVLAMAISVFLGITATMLIGAAAYLLTLVAVTKRTSGRLTAPST